MAAEPDGFNINQACGSTEPQALRQVVEEKADFGIAFDGDGDRLAMVDSHGALLDGDRIVVHHCTRSPAASTLQGGVVGTVMSNLGFEQALDRLGILWTGERRRSQHSRSTAAKRMAMGVNLLGIF